MGDEIGRKTQWFFNVRTGQTEQEGQSRSSDLLGPYPTQEAAASALQSVHDREERLKSEDKKWAGNDEV